MISPAVADQIQRSAAEVHRLYRSWAEAADIEQEMWLWVYSHHSQLDDMPPYTLRRRLKDAGVRYCRREKAAKSGYHPEDEYTYTQPVLLKLLPDAFDPEATKPVTGSDGVGTRGTGEQAYGEWETMLIDVRVALDKLRFSDWKVLKQVAEGAREPNDTLTQDALRRLQRKVNRPAG